MQISTMVNFGTGSSRRFKTWREDEHLLFASPRSRGIYKLQLAGKWSASEKMSCYWEPVCAENRGGKGELKDFVFDINLKRFLAVRNRYQHHESGVLECGVAPECKILSVFTRKKSIGLHYRWGLFACLFACLKSGVIINYIIFMLLCLVVGQTESRGGASTLRLPTLYF